MLLGKSHQDDLQMGLWLMFGVVSMTLNGTCQELEPHALVLLGKPRRNLYLFEFALFIFFIHENIWRPGRWRSFPYLAELDGKDGDVLWNYLCEQWDFENDVHKGNGGKKLLRFNFFMLQADVLPNMGFSATRKRKIYSHICHSDLDDTMQYNNNSRSANASEL